MKIGYARVSSAGQDLGVQLAALEAAGCERIFQEKKSGTSTTGRAELEAAIAALRAGDVLAVTRLDRLARSVGDLHGLVQRIDGAGAGFLCLQQGGVDTTTSSGKLMLSVLGAVAEFENDIRKERQREGIERAKQRGVYRRRGPMNVPRIDRDQVAALVAKDLGPADIARRLGIGRSSVYRILDELGLGSDQLSEPPD